MVQRIVAYHLYSTAMDMDTHVSEDEYQKEAGSLGGEWKQKKVGNEKVVPELRLAKRPFDLGIMVYE